MTKFSRAQEDVLSLLERPHFELRICWEKKYALIWDRKNFCFYDHVVYFKTARKLVDEGVVELVDMYKSRGRFDDSYSVYRIKK